MTCKQVRSVEFKLIFHPGLQSTLVSSVQQSVAGWTYPVSHKQFLHNKVSDDELMFCLKHCWL